MTRLRNLVLAVLCLGVVDVALAGVNVWTTNGPEEGNSRALAIDPANPATLSAGTSGGGVLKSSNGGESWTAVNTGLASADVIELAIDPSALATLYAATSRGVFNSSNSGERWTAINAGLTYMSVYALAVDPWAPATSAGTFGGIFKSTDGGGSWTFTFGYNNVAVDTLAIDPSA